MGLLRHKKRRLEKILKKIEGERIVLTDRIKADSQKLETLEKGYKIGEESGLEKIFELFSMSLPKEIEEFIYHAVDKAEASADISFLYDMLKSDELKVILDKCNNTEFLKKLLIGMYDEGYNIEEVNRLYNKVIEIIETNYPKPIREFVDYATDKIEKPEDVLLLYDMTKSTEFKVIVSKHRDKIETIAKLLREMYNKKYNAENVKEVYRKLLQ